MTGWLALGAFIALAIKTGLDWRDHAGNRARRIADVLLLILGLGAFIGTALKARVDSRAADERDRQAKSDHARDQGKIDLLVSQLTYVQDGMNEIRTKVATQPLLEKIAELDSRISALRAIADKRPSPVPQATLVPTFFTNDLPFKPRTTINTVRDSEGTISIPVAVQNDSDVLATNVSLWVSACLGCTIVQLPPGLQQPPGTPVWKAQGAYPRMEPRTITPNVDIKVKVPLEVSYFELAVSTFCDTCGKKRMDYLVVSID
jgi:hypothetical protein